MVRHPSLLRFTRDPLAFVTSMAQAGGDVVRYRLGGRGRVSPAFRSGAERGPASASRSPGWKACCCWPRSRSAGGSASRPGHRVEPRALMTLRPRYGMRMIAQPRRAVPAAVRYRVQ
jgi:hypothetical protein